MPSGDQRSAAPPEIAPPGAPAQPVAVRDPAAQDPPSERLWRAGRSAWALLGLTGVALVALYLMSLLSLVVVAVILALFPATLLAPVASWLKKRGAPSALAAIASIIGAIVLFAAVIGAMVPLVAAELPGLVESAGEGVAEIEALLAAEPFGLEVGGIQDILDAAREQLGEVGDIAAQALSAALVALETITGLLLLFVVLFFYLKDGRRLADGLISLAPDRMRHRVGDIAELSWGTLGSYFRGQLLVALVDAVLIGLGLLVLGVPLAIPLAVLIFFGGLFPIIGAVTTGALAVLVALADGGLIIGLIVLGLVLAVQQAEGNILEPLILSRVIHLHPLVIVLSITAGALLLGILGAFLAVPFAGIVARIAEHLRGENGAGDQEAGQPSAARPRPAQPTA